MGRVYGKQAITKYNIDAILVKPLKQMAVRHHSIREAFAETGIWPKEKIPGYYDTVSQLEEGCKGLVKVMDTSGDPRPAVPVTAWDATALRVSMLDTASPDPPA